MAANYHEQDVTNAEFIRTYRNQTFAGGILVQRLEAEKRRDEDRVLTKVLPSNDSSLFILALVLTSRATIANESHIKAPGSNSSIGKVPLISAVILSNLVSNSVPDSTGYRLTSILHILATIFIKSTYRLPMVVSQYKFIEINFGKKLYNKY